MSLYQASPTEVIAQVAGSHAVEAAHPFLLTAIVGIDVPNMIDTGDDTLTGSQIDGAVGDTHLFGDRCQRFGAIGT